MVDCLMCSTVYLLEVFGIGIFFVCVCLWVHKFLLRKYVSLVTQTLSFRDFSLFNFFVKKCGKYLVVRDFIHIFVVLFIIND